MTALMNIREECAAITRILSPETWTRVNRELVAKILGEFLFEDILPNVGVDGGDGWTAFDLPLGDTVSYRFRARRRAFFGHYRVDPASVVRVEGGEEAPADDLHRVILDAAGPLEIDPMTAAYAVRELTNTLVADAHHFSLRGLSAADMADAGDALVEGELAAHPWIVANKGRMGFGYKDYLAYAPELKEEVRLNWLAVARDAADYNGVDGLGYERLVTEELDARTRARFAEVLRAEGLDPRDYYCLPVHPWQWDHQIVTLFAGEIAARRIIPLGPSEDRYLPQQSIRTFANLSTPAKRYVKVPISILNTSIYRGLPRARLLLAPKLTAWLQGVVDGDPFLRDEARVVLLGEVATINYDHPLYARMPGVPYQFNEMLGVVWRESIHTKLAPGERPITLAALLHVDPDGRPLIAELIDRSGLKVEDWIERFLRVTLEPLLHFVYKYGFVFSPHGQNALLVMKDWRPARFAVKDFVDDANVCVDPLPELADLPPEIGDVLESLEGEVLTQWIQAGLFVGVFRYLTEILEDRLGLPERDFWTVARRVMLGYQERFPELRERFAMFDFFRPAFPKLCLNRVRLFERKYGDDPERPSPAVSDPIENPLVLVAEDEARTAGGPR